MLARFAPSSRGGQKLNAGGYLYRYHKGGAGGKHFWKCDKANPEKNVKGCPGRAQTDGETEGSKVLRTTERNHPPDGNERASWAEAAQALKKRALGDPGSSPQQLVSEATDGFPEGVRTKGPTKKRLKAIVCEARGAAEKKAVRDAEGEAEPAACATNLQSLYIPKKLRGIDGDGNFLLRDSGDGGNRILIFGTQASVDFLRHSPGWSADGAFRTPPRIWQQLYSLHASESGFHIPCLYGLLPTRRRRRIAASGWPR